MSLALVLCMVLTLLPMTGFAAAEPTEDEMKSIFAKSGMLSAFYGSDGGYFEEYENVQDSVAYQYAKDVLYGAEYDQYLDDTGDYWTLPYDEYISLIDSIYVNHSDMKDYLSNYTVNDTTGQKSYDSAADTVTVGAFGGMGDVVAWVPLSIYHNESDEYVPEYNNSDYYVQGLYLYGNEATGDVTDDMVENVDYYLYRSSYTDENGQIVNTESKMAIVTPVELKLTETESGLKIAGYYQISNYIIDNVLYDTYGGKYYPLNVSYYEYDSTAKKYIEVSSNGTNPWVYDVGPLEEAYTLFNGMNWREHRSSSI